MNWHIEVQERRMLRQIRRMERREQDMKDTEEIISGIIMGIMLFSVAFFGSALC